MGLGLLWRKIAADSTAANTREERLVTRIEKVEDEQRTFLSDLVASNARGNLELAGAVRELRGAVGELNDSVQDIPCRGAQKM